MAADLSGLTEAISDARRQTADDPKSRRLLRSLANLEQALHEFTHGEPSDSDADDTQPAGQSLKNAAAKARVILVARRAAAKAPGPG